MVNLFLVSTIFYISCKTNYKPLKHKIIKVKAPFEMPTIPIPDFTNCEQYLITDFGAVQGDQQTISEAIAKAIDAANEAGGGSVIIPKGKWLTGKIHFKIETKHER